MAWAQDLSFDGFSDWPLAAINATSPTTTIHGGLALSAQEFVTFGNELGYMYKFDLGGLVNGVGVDRIGSVASALGAVMLNNIQSLAYWSGTQVDSFNSIFYVSGGNGGSNGEGNATDVHLASAWAVRDGDVGAAIPEPATFALLGLGFAGRGSGRPSGRNRESRRSVNSLTFSL